MPDISSKNAVSRQAKRDSTDTYSLPPGGNSVLLEAILTKSLPPGGNRPLLEAIMLDSHFTPVAFRGSDS